MAFPLPLWLTDEQFLTREARRRRFRWITFIWHLLLGAILIYYVAWVAYIVAQPSPYGEHRGTPSATFGPGQLVAGLSTLVVFAWAISSSLFALELSRSIRRTRLLVDFWQRRGSAASAPASQADEMLLAHEQGLQPRRQWLLPRVRIFFACSVPAALLLPLAFAARVDHSGSAVIAFWGSVLLIGTRSLLRAANIATGRGHKPILLLLRLREEEREAARRAGSVEIFCRSCGYCLRGLSQTRCPECGQPFDPTNRRTFARSARSVTIRRFLAPAGVVGLCLVSLTISLSPIYAAWYGWHYYHYRQVVNLVRERGGTIKADRRGWLPPRVGRIGPAAIGYTDDDLAILAGQRRTLFLDLAGNDISDQGLAHLARLTDMDVLILRETQISDAGLIHLQKMTKLAGLDLSHTLVQGTGMVHLPQVMWLNLRSTRVTDASLAGVGTCRQLYDLNLGNNPISDAGLAHLGQLARLRTLDFSQTNIHGPGLANLSATGLFRLTLRNCPVDDAGLAVALPVLPGIYDLDLQGTGVGDTALTQVPWPARLGRLNLGRSGIGDDGLAVLPGTLETLSLAGTAVGDAGMAKLSQACPRLTHLILRETSIGEGGVANLRGLPQLDSLDLGQTRINDAALALVPQSVTHLNLRHTAITGSGLQHLAQAKIVRLDLSNTVLTDEDLANLPSSIEELNLSGTAITDRGLAHLLRLRALGILDLSHTAIGDEAVPQLVKLPPLRLSLAGTGITDTGLEQLLKRSWNALDLSGTRIGDKGWSTTPSVGALDLSGTLVTDAAMTELQEALNLQILIVTNTAVSAAAVCKLQLAANDQGRSLYVRHREPPDDQTADTATRSGYLPIWYADRDWPWSTSGW